MKTVMCFGDSNTFGYRPDHKGRYDENTRWTGILKHNLKDAEVIEEGLVGRTTVFEDSIRPGRKGSDFLVPLIETHSPVDKLVLMLGTNDCKTLYNTTETTIGLGIERLIREARGYDPNIEILLVSPIYLGDEVYKKEFDPEFNEESVRVSKRLKETYSKIAEEYRCSFLAASDVAKPSVQDQEHMDEEGHKALAKAVYDLLETA